MESRVFIRKSDGERFIISKDGDNVIISNAGIPVKSTEREELLKDFSSELDFWNSCKPIDVCEGLKTFKQFLKESRSLKENLSNETLEHDYEFSYKCTDKENADELQEITHWDDTFSSNDYCIDDEYFNTEVFIISNEDFLKHINGERPKPENIDYCAWNKELDIVFCYDKKGIHWIYE